MTVLVSRLAHNYSNLVSYFTNQHRLEYLEKIKNKNVKYRLLNDELRASRADENHGSTKLRTPKADKRRTQRQCSESLQKFRKRK